MPTPTDQTKAAVRPAGGRESASQSQPSTPESAGIAPGGREAVGVEVWRERATKRENRLRAVVAKALLSTGDCDAPTAEAAIDFLRRVVDGVEAASVETRTQAAATLARAAVSVSRGMRDAGPVVDARSVTVLVGQSEARSLPAVPDAVRAALDSLESDTRADTKA